MSNGCIKLIIDEKERQYYTGFSSTYGYLILDGTKKIYYTDSRYISAARALEAKGFEVVLTASYEPFFDYVKANGIERVGINFDLTTMTDERELKTCGAELYDISMDTYLEMSVKREDELSSIKKACEIAEKVFTDTLPLLHKGATEEEIAYEMEYMFREYGASDRSFETIVAFGENAAVPHHKSGADKLKNNTCVLIDFGCVYNGYCSDMTRTLFYGEPDKEFLKAYDAVYGAHVLAKERIRSGMTGKEADAIARDELIRRGYGDKFTHSLGHGIGVNIHEYPRLSPKSEAILRDNMVFSIEPGVYIDGKFGIRIEDTVTLNGGVVESFMKQSKKLINLKK